MLERFGGLPTLHGVLGPVLFFYLSFFLHMEQSVSFSVPLSVFYFFIFNWKETLTLKFEALVYLMYSVCKVIYYKYLSWCLGFKVTYYPGKDGNEITCSSNCLNTWLQLVFLYFFFWSFMKTIDVHMEVSSS